MTARRPARLEVLDAIAQTWALAQPTSRVRLARCCSIPGSPPAITMPLLAVCTRNELVRSAAPLGVVRQCCAARRSRAMLERLPPLRESEAPESDASVRTRARKRNANGAQPSSSSLSHFNTAPTLMRIAHSSHRGGSSKRYSSPRDHKNKPEPAGGPSKWLLAKVAVEALGDDAPRRARKAGCAPPRLRVELWDSVGLMAIRWRL